MQDKMQDKLTKVELYAWMRRKLDRYYETLQTSDNEGTSAQALTYIYVGAFILRTLAQEPVHISVSLLDARMIRDIEVYKAIDPEIVSVWEELWKNNPVRKKYDP